MTRLTVKKVHRQAGSQVVRPKRGKRISDVTNLKPEKGPVGRPTNETINIQLRLIPTGKNSPPVVYKVEGRKFRHMHDGDTCLKLREGMEYGVALQLEPCLPVESQVMEIISYDFVKEEEVVEMVEEVKLRPGPQCYFFSWRCTMPVSENGCRRKVVAALNLKDFGRVEIPLLVKIYSEDDRKNSLNGFPMEAAHLTYRLDPSFGCEPSLMSLDVDPASCILSAVNYA